MTVQVTFTIKVLSEKLPARALVGLDDELLKQELTAALVGILEKHHPVLVKELQVSQARVGTLLTL